MSKAFVFHLQEKMGRLFEHADLDSNGCIDCVDSWHNVRSHNGLTPKTTGLGLGGALGRQHVFFQRDAF